MSASSSSFTRKTYLITITLNFLDNAAHWRECILNELFELCQFLRVQGACILPAVRFTGGTVRNSTSEARGEK